jgi:hypothetical protein
MKLHAALRVAPRSELRCLRCLDLQRGTRRRLRRMRVAVLDPRELARAGDRDVLALLQRLRSSYRCGA